MKYDGGKSKWEFRQELKIGRVRSHTEDGGEIDGKNVHQQEISNGVSVGGPLFHF